MADGWGSWESQRSTPNHGRPPQHSGPTHSVVPSWEKRFCTSVCLIPWGRICAAKASLSAYRNIAEWDDSAALEAFQNAKACYWAHINGLFCSIPLPDPNLYIDKINHKAIVDPKLVEDLEKHPPPPLPDMKDDHCNNGWDSFIFANKSIQATGWGHAEHNSSANWDKYIEQQPPCPSNAWECSGNWGDSAANNSSWRDEGNNNSWNNRRDPTWGQNRSSEQGGRNNRKRNGGQYGGHYDSRFSKSRQMNNNYVENRNDNWKDTREICIAEYPVETTVRGGQPVFMRQSKSMRGT